MHSGELIKKYSKKRSAVTGVSGVEPKDPKEVLGSKVIADKGESEKKGNTILQSNKNTELHNNKAHKNHSYIIQKTIIQ